MHFEGVMLDSEFDNGNRATVINGAQRVQCGGSLGRQAGASELLSGDQQVAQERSGEAGHVAGDHQIPVCASGFQGGMEAADGSAAGRQIGQNGKPKMCVALGRADQRHVSSSGADHFGSSLDEKGTVDGEERFVAPHAGAAAAGKDESRCRVHEKMVAMQRRYHRATLRPNKMVYICFLAIVMLAASPMRAADLATSSLLTPLADAGKVSVVRVDRRTGRLVRTVSGGATRPASIAPPPAHIQQLLEKSAKAHNVDPLLVQSVIQVESNYNHYAVSPKGAEGLMQLMPGTARMLGVTNSFDPAENIEAGVKYLRYLQNVYRDDRLALAAYNAGPKAVDRYKGAPPYAETQDYVNQVGQRYQTAKHMEAARIEAEKAAAARDTIEAAAPAEEKHPKLEQSIDQDGRLVLRTAQE